MPQATNNKSRDVIAKTFFTQKGKRRTTGKYVFVGHILPSPLKVETARGVLLLGRFEIIHGVSLMKRCTAITGHAVKGCRNLGDERTATHFKIEYITHGI